jgi:hypothetical protein
MLKTFILVVRANIIPISLGVLFGLVLVDCSKKAEAEAHTLVPAGLTMSVALSEDQMKRFEKSIVLNGLLCNPYNKNINDVQRCMKELGY